MDPVFRYGETEIAHLKRRDRRFAEVIDRVGPISRTVIPDLFTALVHSIVGQQIAAKAHETVWRRMTSRLAPITPERILGLGPDELQAFGISHRKAGYIRSAALRIADGSFDLPALHTMDDKEVCTALTRLDGIGIWSAEMLMLFSMQRPDVLSFGDLVIRRGLRMLYRHRTVTPKLFEKYRRRYTPYGSVASLYLWAVASGAVEGLTDPAPKRKTHVGRKDRIR